MAKTKTNYDMAKIEIIGFTRPPKGICKDPLITKAHKNCKPKKLTVSDPSNKFLRIHKKG